VKDDPQFVTALARGVQVLRCFTPDRVELGTTDIAALTGLPQSTVWRLCYTLTRLGCLEPGRNAEKLRVAVGALTLGQTSLTHAGLAAAARAPMQEIADRFGSSVSLAGRDGLSMVIVQRAEGPTILRLNFRVGSQLTIARSALGWAYLAGTDAAERDEIIAACCAAEPDGGVALHRTFDSVLAQHARTGYVLNLRDYHPQVNAIAVPVVGADRRTVMALNCGGASSVLTLEKLTGPIAAAMTALAERLAGLLTMG
jgi:DNA-binding IclR family transcriptional regulator